MIDPSDFQPVNMAEAAELAGLIFEVLLALAHGIAGWPEGDRLTIILGADGRPWFDPRKCRGLAAILAGLGGRGADHASD